MHGIHIGDINASSWEVTLKLRMESYLNSLQSAKSSDDWEGDDWEGDD